MYRFAVHGDGSPKDVGLLRTGKGCLNTRACLVKSVRLYAPELGFSKPDQANTGLMKFFTSISDPATCTSLNEEKLGPFLWFSTLQSRRFGEGEKQSVGRTAPGESISRSINLIINRTIN